MTQTGCISLIKAVANFAVSYALAVMTQIVVFRWFSLSTRLYQNLAIGAIFTAGWVIRAYALRWLFEAKVRRWSG